MADDTLTTLTAYQRQLDAALEGAKKVGESAKNGFGLDTLVALDVAMRAAKFTPPVILSNLIGYGTLGEFASKTITGKGLKAAIDDFRHPDNIAAIKKNHGLDSEAELAKNPILKFINNLLDKIVLSDDQVTTKAEIDAIQKQREENQRRIDEISEQKAAETELRKIKLEAVQQETAELQREIAQAQLEKMKAENLRAIASEPIMIINGEPVTMTSEMLKAVQSVRVMPDQNDVMPESPPRTPILQATPPSELSSAGGGVSDSATPGEEPAATVVTAVPITAEEDPAKNLKRVPKNKEVAGEKAVTALG